MNQNQVLDFHQSPLSLQQIELIDELNLSVLQKHHLRLLAHCLFTFKEMSPNCNSVPSKSDVLKWCEKNPILKNDSEFIHLLTEQFLSAGIVLERIAENIKIELMDLTLDDLINDALLDNEDNIDKVKI